MNKNELSIRSILFSIWHHLVLILLITALFAVGTWATCQFLITPVYTTSAKMIAISNKERDSNIYTTGEHNAAVMLVYTMSEVIKTDTILDEVSNNLLTEYGLNYSTRRLQSMVSVTSLNETEVFRIQVTGTSKNDLPVIANTIAEVTQNRIVGITKAGEATTLQLARTVTLKSPNTFRNTVLGALIGFILAAVFMILRDFNDTTIWTEEDLSTRFDIPVLGMIPQINMAETAQK